MKIIIHGKTALYVYAPLYEDIIRSGRPKRGFFPDIQINGNIFSYHYNTENYINKNILVSGSPQIEESCNECPANTIPQNPLQEKKFDNFQQEMKYEASSMEDGLGLGLYRFSKMALARIGFISADGLLDDEGEYKWTKKAQKLGIKNNSDFTSSLRIQEKAFREYITLLHRLVAKQGKKALCRKVTDIYRRTGAADYWGLLKGAYMSGPNGVLYAPAKHYDGTDVNKFILDGVALSTPCLKKIITGSILKENVIVMQNGCSAEQQRGRIE